MALITSREGWSCEENGFISPNDVIGTFYESGFQQETIYLSGCTNGLGGETGEEPYFPYTDEDNNVTYYGDGIGVIVHFSNGAFGFIYLSTYYDPRYFVNWNENRNYIINGQYYHSVDEMGGSGTAWFDYLIADAQDLNDMYGERGVEYHTWNGEYFTVPSLTVDGYTFYMFGVTFYELPAAVTISTTLPEITVNFPMYLSTQNGTQWQRGGSEDYKCYWTESEELIEAILKEVNFNGLYSSGTSYLDKAGTQLLISETKRRINLKQDIFQVAELPAASESLLGKIYQYTGDTTTSLTRGCTYECVSDGADPAAYSWELVDNYLPLTGGTVTGNTNFTDGIDIEINNDDASVYRTANTHITADNTTDNKKVSLTTQATDGVGSSQIIKNADITLKDGDLTVEADTRQYGFVQGKKEILFNNQDLTLKASAQMGSGGNFLSTSITLDSSDITFTKVPSTGESINFTLGTGDLTTIAPNSNNAIVPSILEFSDNTVFWDDALNDLSINLCPKVKAGSYQSNGVTFVVAEDGTVTANGTATATAILSLTTDLVLKSGTSYWLKGCPEDGSSSTYFIVAGATGVSNVRDYGSGVAYTANENPVTIQAIVANGSTATDVVFTPMLTVQRFKTVAYQPHIKSNVELAKENEALQAADASIRSSINSRINSVRQEIGVTQSDEDHGTYNFTPQSFTQFFLDLWGDYETSAVISYEFSSHNNTFIDSNGVKITGAFRVLFLGSYWNSDREDDAWASSMGFLTTYGATGGTTGIYAIQCNWGDALDANDVTQLHGIYLTELYSQQKRRTLTFTTTAGNGTDETYLSTSEIQAKAPKGLRGSYRVTVYRNTSQSLSYFIGWLNLDDADLQNAMFYKVGGYGTSLSVDGTQTKLIYKDGDYAATTTWVFEPIGDNHTDD